MGQVMDTAEESRDAAQMPEEDQEAKTPHSPQQAGNTLWNRFLDVGWTEQLDLARHLPCFASLHCPLLRIRRQEQALWECKVQYFPVMMWWSGCTGSDRIINALWHTMTEHWGNFQYGDMLRGGSDFHASYICISTQNHWLGWKYRDSNEFS